MEKREFEAQEKSGKFEEMDLRMLSRQKGVEVVGSLSESGECKGERIPGRSPGHRHLRDKEKASRRTSRNQRWEENLDTSMSS